MHIPFDVITVLTSTSLDYPDELFDFYIEHGVTSVAFNVEEIEGPHVTSSLSGSGIEPRFRRFYSRFMDLALASDPPLRVREFDSAYNSISHHQQPDTRTQECRPFAILNVDYEGNFSTYSPELLGLSSPRHGSFALGNVARDTLEIRAGDTAVRCPRRRDPPGRGYVPGNLPLLPVLRGRPARQQVFRERRLRHNRNDVLPPAQEGDLRRRTR